MAQRECNPLTAAVEVTGRARGDRRSVLRDFRCALTGEPALTRVRIQTQMRLGGSREFDEGRRLTIKTVASRVAYRAIKHGLRLPPAYKLNAFRQHTRTLDEIKNRGINVVLDVGANRGFYSEHLRAAGYDGHILAFEPVRECFEELARRAAGDAKWQVFNCALGREAGEIDFNVVWVGNDEVVLSSVLTPKMNLRTNKRVVQMRTLADVLKADVKINRPCIFLKMDTQGYDLNVFAGANNAPEIQLLLSEVSAVESYEGMPRYTEALDCYHASGFQLLDLFILGETGDGAIGEFDVLLGR